MPKFYFYFFKNSTTTMINTDTIKDLRERLVALRRYL